MPLPELHVEPVSRTSTLAPGGRAENAARPSPATGGIVSRVIAVVLFALLVLAVLGVAWLAAASRARPPRTREVDAPGPARMPPREAITRYVWEGGHEHAPDSRDGWCRVELTREDRGATLIAEHRRGGRRTVHRGRVDPVALDRVDAALREAGFPAVVRGSELPALVPGTTHDLYRVFDDVGGAVALSILHHEPGARAYEPALALFATLLAQVSGGTLGHDDGSLPSCVRDVERNPRRTGAD